MEFSNFALPLVLFVATLAFGFTVSALGKPYRSVFVTTHKLIALAGVLFSVIVILRLIKISIVQPLVILMLALAALGVILLFLSGALLTALKSPSKLWTILHHASPYLLAGAAMAAIFLLNQSI